MTNSKNTKRALLASILSVVLCCAMLIGSTFAWFTDSASTAVNNIQAGTLDVQLVDAETGANLEGQTLNWKKAAEAPAGEAVLWEPGCTYELPDVKIKNNGDLALKYKLVVSGVEGNAKLLEAIEFTYGNGIDLNTEGHLKAGETSSALTIKGHMKETAGNEYQGLSIDGIGITVVATQDTVEYDSNDNQYDDGAEYATPVSTQEELLVALEKGENVVLTQQVTLPDAIEVAGNVTIYGSENGTLSIPDGDSKRVININEQIEPVTLTLSGVNVEGPKNGTYTRGISVYGNKDVTIVVDNSSVSASYYALNIASANENVEAVIKNTTLTGWCAAQTHSANTKMTFENCTLTGNNDKTYNADGWNNFATIVVNETAGGSELTFNNCTIEANQTTGNVQNLISIRADSTINCDGCTFIVDGSKLNTVEEVLQHVDVNAGVNPTYSITNIK